MRQVEIALYLQNFSKAFVEGTIDLEQFSIKCEKEAQQVFRSTPFPFFLKSIGNTLYWQGRGAFVSWSNLPITVMAWTRERTIALLKNNASWLQLANLIRQVPAQHAKAMHWVQEERESHEERGDNHDEEQKWKAMQFNKALEFPL